MLKEKIEKIRIKFFIVGIAYLIALIVSGIYIHDVLTEGTQLFASIIWIIAMFFWLDWLAELLVELKLLGKKIT